MALPEHFVNPDGTIKPDYAQAAIAYLSYEDGIPTLGANPALKNAGLSDAQIAELAERGRRAAQGDPNPQPSPEDDALRRGEEAIQRAEDRQRKVRAARALLDEQRAPFGYDSSILSDEEALQEAGLIAHSDPAVQRQRELARYNERVVSDPAFAEQELRKRAVKDFAATFPSMHPHVRVEKAKELGLSEAEFQSIADDWTKRFTTT